MSEVRSRDEQELASARELFQRRSSLAGISRSQPSGTSAPSTRLRPAAEEVPDTSPTDYVSVKAALQERVIDEMQRRNLLGAGEDVLTAAVGELVHEVIASEDLLINEAERGHLAEELVEASHALSSRRSRCRTDTAVHFHTGLTESPRHRLDKPRC